MGKDNENNNFFSIFTGIDKLINVVADMVDNGKEEVNILGDINKDNKKLTGKYGFHVKLGPEKLDHLSDINLNKIIEEFNPKKAIEPITDIFEEEDRIIVVSELPGVLKDEITLKLDQNVLSFTAEKKDLSYAKRIELDFVPERELISESFSNSVYSITIIKSTSNT